MAAGIIFSRRLFLSCLGFATLFAARLTRSAAAAEAGPGEDSRLVVVRGWVLRRDDLDRLPPL